MDNPGTADPRGGDEAPHAVHVHRTTERTVGAATLDAVEDEGAALDRPGGPWIGQVADRDLDREAGEARQAHHPPHQHAHPGAVLHHEALDQPAADEAGCSRDQDSRPGKLQRRYGPVLPTEAHAARKSHGHRIGSLKSCAG